jgi:hypothetical protein
LEPYLIVNQWVFAAELQAHYELKW